LKATNLTVAVILIVALFAVLAYTGNLDFSETPALNVYKGRLQVNLIQIKRIDGSKYAFVDSQMRVIHGSRNYNDKVGELSSASITGDMKAEDNGRWWLIIDYATNNTAWLDAAQTLKMPYVKSIVGWDGDKDGFDEEAIELDFSGLSPLTAGEDKKVVDVTLINSPARTASITYTNLTNSTGISTTSYSYKTATGYMGGYAEGDMAKLAKIQIVFSNTGNGTYPDSEYWKLTHLKIGGYTFTSGDFGTYDLSNTRFEIKFGDQINSQGGKDYYYPKNGGDLWATYELKAYCKYPSASKVIVPLIKFYFYKPDGSITSAFIEYVSFAS